MCTVKIGCKFRRRMQACNFVYLSPRRSVNTAEKRTILTFWYPYTLLPQAIIHVASQSWLVQYILGMDQLKKLCYPKNGISKNSGITRLASYSKEEAVYSASVGEAAFSFSLLYYWYVLEKGKMRRKDGAVNHHSRSITPPGPRHNLTSGTGHIWSDQRTLKYFLTLKPDLYAYRVVLLS